MPKISWDAISGVTQIVTVLYLFYQFHYLPNRERKAALENLRVLFELSRSKVEKLIEDITLYQVQNDCEYGVFQPGITFRSQLLHLHHLKLTDLSDEALNTVMTVATSDQLIATMADSLNKQIFAFTQVEGYFNAAFKYKQY